MPNVRTGERPAAPVPSKASRFDEVAIGFHWLTLGLVIAQLATAWLLVEGEEGASGLLTLHRSVGIVTWIVVALRLLWRARFADLPPFPNSMSWLQRLAAKSTEYALYALLLLQPLTGLGDTIFRGRPFAFIRWRIPAFAHIDKPVFHALHFAHELGAVALIGMIGLHAGAALLHGVVLRDGVFQRMLPWTIQAHGAPRGKETRRVAPQGSPSRPRS